MAKGSLTADSERPLGLVLSGGGARGAFQVGVWSVLRRHPKGFDRDPEVVSGTSAGSINASLIAAGLTPDQMLRFWIDLGRRPPVVANDALFASLQRALRRVLLREPLRGLRRRRRGLRILGGLVRKHKIHSRAGLLAAALEFLMTARFDTVSAVLEDVETAHVFDTGPFRQRLVEAIGGESIRRPRVRLAINTVDVHSGSVVRFVSHDPHRHSSTDASQYVAGEITVDMILASASIPLLFNTVRIGDHELWDGGLLVNTPLAPAVALGARRIVPVLVTSGKPSRARETMTLGAGVERLADAFLENAYNTDRKLLLERNTLAASLPERKLALVELFQAIRPASSRIFDAGSYLYFSPKVLTEMYEAGRAAARRWLASGPLLDDSIPPARFGQGRSIKRPGFGS